MDKFELIDRMEGRYVSVLNGTYYLVKDGMIATEVGTIALRLYEVGQLEVMLKYSKEKEIEEWQSS